MEEPDLEESSTNARKDVIGDINSSRSRRWQVAKYVRALRWACVKRAWPLIRTSIAATHDGISIRTSCWFASMSNFVRRDSWVIVMIWHCSCSSRRRCDTPFELQGRLVLLWLSREKDHAHRWRHIYKMETKHRPSTYDDGVKHYFALLKITSKWVSGYVWREHRYEWAKFNI